MQVTRANEIYYNPQLYTYTMKEYVTTLTKAIAALLAGCMKHRSFEPQGAEFWMKSDLRRMVADHQLHHNTEANFKY